MSADEIKKTPDVQAAAEPEESVDTAAETPVAPESAAAEPEPGEKPAAEKAAAEKPAAKKPAVKKPQKAAAGKPAAKTTAKKAAPKKAAAAADAPASDVPEPRKSARKAAVEAAPEPRRGAPGMATFVDAAGAEVETRQLAEARFAVAADVDTLHLVVRAEQAARRSGTASTKTRGEVSGSTAKLYRQKGTGRARAGSVKSPLRTGGGTTFGPKPRAYTLKVNKKVGRKALAMALSDRAANGRVFVAAGLRLDEPSTHAVEQFLVNLDCAAPVLVVTHDEPVVVKSVRNLPYAEASEVAALSTEQVLRARSLVLTEKAFTALNEA